MVSVIPLIQELPVSTRGMVSATPLFKKFSLTTYVLSHGDCPWYKLFSVIWNAILSANLYIYGKLIPTIDQHLGDNVLA